MTHARNFALKIKFCALSFFYHNHNKKLRIITMADDNNTGNFTVNIEGPSIASSGVQPFCVPVHFIDKNTTIDAEFARKYYQYHQFFDLTVIHNLRFNISNSQQPPINSYNDDIGRVIQIYQNVVKNIKQNCRMHLHNMICQRCKEVNWLLEGTGTNIHG